MGKKYLFLPEPETGLGIWVSSARIQEQTKKGMGPAQSAKKGPSVFELLVTLMAEIPANICESVAAKTPLPEPPAQPEMQPSSSDVALGGLYLLEHLFPFLEGGNPELGENRAAGKSWEGQGQNTKSSGSSVSQQSHFHHTSHTPAIPMASIHGTSQYHHCTWGWIRAISSALCLN